MKPTKSKLSAIAAVGILALGAAGTAQARHGADDPAGHQRHGRGGDDAQPHFKHGADDRAGHVRRGRGKDDAKPHFKRGADDPAGDQRQGRGKDDGPNHR
jgi:Ni/Co efflux regulator RcnB